jgi:transposase
VRTYKPRPTYRRSRTEKAVRLRAGGLSLRAIGMQLGVSYQTVFRDLRAWDAQQATVSHLPVTKSAPGGEFCDAGSDSAGAVVLPMRRSS